MQTSPPPPPLPRAFGSSAVLRWLAVSSIGLALAACTAPMRAFGFGHPVVPLSTLFYALLWARLMRPKSSHIAFGGWPVSIPLAAMNAGTAFAVTELHRGDLSPQLGTAFGNLFAGATFGALVWVPALTATLVLFGPPLLYAQRAALQGITGEDRGSALVGGVTSVFSVVAFVLVDGARRPVRPFNGPWPLEGDALFRFLVVAFALLGLATGLAMVAIAWARLRRRRAFLQGVRDGAIGGYRIEAPESLLVTGRERLVRVTEPELYRVPAVVEGLYELDARGEPSRATAGR